MSSNLYHIALPIKLNQCPWLDLTSIIPATTCHQRNYVERYSRFNSCKGQITQETLNLIMFYHNHRRYKSGKRQGKAPIELLTGEPLEASWWELLRQQINAEPGVTDPRTLPTRSPLQLVTNNEWGTDQQTIASGQAIIAPTDASGRDRRHKDAQAA